MARKSIVVLFGSTLLLLVLGFVMQGSISPFMPKAQENGAYFHLIRQLGFAAAGLAFMAVAAKINFRFIEKMAWPLYGLAIVLLILCFIPPMGIELNGAKRWINLGFQFQPSEFAKLAGIIAVAAWSSKYAEYQETFSHGFAYPLLIIGILAALIGAEVDLGNSSLLLMGTTAVLFVAGARILHIGMLVGLAVGSIYLAVQTMPERMGRITAFTNLELYRDGDALQQWLAQRALGTGGEWGVGIGQSIEKRPGGMPYANSDFIFPIIGEELGMWLSLAVIFGYVLICISGIVIATHAPTRFGKLLAFGISTIISLQAILHIGVCLALLPNKGTALPFVSAGGTNLVILLSCIGILANIYRQGRHLSPEAEPILSKGKLTPAL